MPLNSYDYAVIRVVPRVERAESINVGVIVFCRTLRFLGASIALDRARALALCSSLDVAEVERNLKVIPLICHGDETGGPIARLDRPARFHWLVAPRSTVIQTSAVHCGLCESPDRELQRLMERMVL